MNIWRDKMQLEDTTFCNIFGSAIDIDLHWWQKEVNPEQRKVPLPSEIYVRL